ncbi:DedA family protein [Allofrancisella guangzhouensis]|uniref:Membrane protein n=1 Tax=Allofrancisella guangzhouensis TaxID=594679 RepID=A0A0A8E1T6_9GAMM|nr:DedA family protein [Allofrancisella guangzhouensis]AJC48170.1 membrane protein [Allofrancisella guangzhouensis]MBK2027036.1 DedA family protein [Allofrancisella guangzhouensis]MBK2044526.1 DedA family protein [Allofrancisella guangzhouensis]MBK2046142.1 DedA family protein [Allofrancisella guangzhouensis]
MSEHDFWQLLVDWGYIAVAIAVLIEGEIFLIMVGIATAASLFNYPLVIIAATIGAIVHDNSIFIFSKLTGKKFIEKKQSWQAKANQSLKILNKYDIWAILSIRFLYGLRTITIFIVGLSKISKLKFVTLDAISSFIWSYIYITLGFFSGQTILSFIDHVHIVDWISHNKYLSIFILLLISSIIYFSYKLIYVKTKRQAK